MLKNKVRGEGTERNVVAMDSHNRQKKIAVINDLTGFGRCALTVAIPVISAMGIQCCPVPTSILSNHTAFPSCYMDDYTDRLDSYIAEWEKLDLKFAGIYSGFLGSQEQMGIVKNFIEQFSQEDTQVLIDPVMGDNGKIYRSYTSEMCAEMKKLLGYGTITTPNLTEACILTDTPYKTDWTEQELERMALVLHQMGPQKVVITGIWVNHQEQIGNYCMENGKGQFIAAPRAGTSRCGTGDLFASILIADAVKGTDLGVSVEKATMFIDKAVLVSDALGIPPTDGVSFEEFLGDLTH